MTLVNKMNELKELKTELEIHSNIYIYEELGLLNFMSTRSFLSQNKEGDIYIAKAETWEESDIIICKRELDISAEFIIVISDDDVYFQNLSYDPLDVSMSYYVDKALEYLLYLKDKK